MTKITPYKIPGGASKMISQLNLLQWATLASLFALSTFASAEERIDNASFERSFLLGENLWNDSKLGSNGSTCSQCHPKASNIDVGTFPKYHQGLKKVAQIHEVINQCIEGALKGKKMPADDNNMTALVSYLMSMNAGKIIFPNKINVKP